MDAPPPPPPPAATEEPWSVDTVMLSHAHAPFTLVAPMDVRCQCGAVHFRMPPTAGQQPLALYHCHCRECRRQSSTAYGTSAVFPAAGVFPLDPDLRSKLSVYIRPGARARTGRDMACYFCTACGARVMHRYLKSGPGSGDPGGSQGRGAADDQREPGPAGTGDEGCGGGGDLVGGGSSSNPGHPGHSDSTQEPAATATTATATTTEGPDLDDEASFDGTTLTVKGGLICELDYTPAVHIYTAQAVVPIPAGATQYPGTPPPETS